MNNKKSIHDIPHFPYPKCSTPKAARAIKFDIPPGETINESRAYTKKKFDKITPSKNYDHWRKYTVSTVLLRMLNSKPDIVHIIKNYYARSEAEASVMAKTSVGFDFPKHRVESVLIQCENKPTSATHSIFRI